MNVDAAVHGPPGRMLSLCCTAVAFCPAGSAAQRRPTRTPEDAKYAIATSRAGRDVESLTFRGRVPGSPTGAVMNA
ncbi:hypothetical protein OH76DRAFT_1400043 [Lentinus brumalis]|uniref:Uncharacterized protein n=1 Tax=Lentinus brumalis TaxID=2498619 RepID=A0A371DJS6_9APHY|nr:hypothetical protein OH76DRAFT_1400043 [Polyporus brumalis]